LEAAGAEVMALSPATAAAGQGQDAPGRVDLVALFAELARREVNEVLVEAGPTLAGAALQAGLVDELVLYLAPHLMGDFARGLLRLPGLAEMRQRIPLELTDLRHLGPDLRLTLRASRAER